MRVRHASLTVALLSGALALAGCTGSDQVDPTAEAATETAAVTVGDEGPFPDITGEDGERPELSFPDAEPSEGLQASVLTVGDGATVASGDLLVVDYLGQVWGGDVFDTSYDRGVPAAFAIGTGAVIEGWDSSLVGQQVGSRIVLTIPPDLGYGSAGNDAAGITGTDTLVFVVDILDTYSGDSAGAADAEATAEASTVGPTVEGDLGAPASVTVEAGTAEPEEITTTVLATASGEPAAPGQLVLQYAATYWDNSDGESTWELGTPAAVDVGAGGAFDSLVGVPIGSRVLLEMPGSEDTPSIAVVIDILGQLSTT